MCNRRLLTFITSVIVSCTICSCNQKPQDASVIPSAENKSTDKDSLILPITAITTNYAVEGRQSQGNDYPKTITVARFDTIATPIAFYEASQFLWLGPKGYTGIADAGADGTVLVALFTPGRSKENPPFVHYHHIPACVGCMMSAAAPYFENAKTDLLNTFDSTMLNWVKKPDSLVIQKRSATLVTYTCIKDSSIQISGVVYYNPPTGGFEQAEFALGPNNKALTDILVNRYISMWDLK